eukprot:TRINITY_DN21117_c0_g1_i1.p1 TRINITY_DN21117_c0_g1~~TRINITY_DN21117_c0_g1_i1.p1  ORF type:complete len:1599 (+),score=385.92 TRINITY_DN21117_c0_g1_i1:98-4894(+)
MAGHETDDEALSKLLESLAQARARASHAEHEAERCRVAAKSLRSAGALRLVARVRPRLDGEEDEDADDAVRVIGSTQLEVVAGEQSADCLLSQSLQQSLSQVARRRRLSTGGICDGAASSAPTLLGGGLAKLPTKSSEAARSIVCDRVFDERGPLRCGRGRRGSLPAGGAAVDRQGTQQSHEDALFGFLKEDLLAATEGEAVCIMVAGSVGSGKAEALQSLASRAARELDRLSTEAAHLDETERLEVRIQVLEIVGDRIFDRLADAGDGPKLLLPESSAAGDVFVHGASTWCLSGAGVDGGILTGVERAWRTSVALCGAALRRPGEDIDAHLVMTLQTSLLHAASGVPLRKVGTLSFVELASSGRSLVALMDVLLARERRCTHVPYESSLLTQLLQRPLGTSAAAAAAAGMPQRTPSLPLHEEEPSGRRAVLLLAIAPCMSQQSETLRTVTLGTRLLSYRPRRAATAAAATAAAAAASAGGALLPAWSVEGAVDASPVAAPLREEVERLREALQAKRGEISAQEQRLGEIESNIAEEKAQQDDLQQAEERQARLLSGLSSFEKRLRLVEHSVEEDGTCLAAAAVTMSMVCRSASLQPPTTVQRRASAEKRQQPTPMSVATACRAHSMRPLQLQGRSGSGEKMEKPQTVVPQQPSGVQRQSSERSTKLEPVLRSSGSAASQPSQSGGGRASTGSSSSGSGSSSMLSSSQSFAEELSKPMPASSCPPFGRNLGVGARIVPKLALAGLPRGKADPAASTLSAASGTATTSSALSMCMEAVGQTAPPDVPTPTRAKTPQAAPQEALLPGFGVLPAAEDHRETSSSSACSSSASSSSLASSSSSASAASMGAARASPPSWSKAPHAAKSMSPSPSKKPQALGLLLDFSKVVDGSVTPRGFLQQAERAEQAEQEQCLAGASPESASKAARVRADVPLFAETARRSASTPVPALSLPPRRDSRETPQPSPLRTARWGSASDEAQDDQAAAWAAAALPTMTPRWGPEAVPQQSSSRSQLRLARPSLGSACSQDYAWSAGGLWTARGDAGSDDDRPPMPTAAEETKRPPAGPTGAMAVSEQMTVHRLSPPHTTSSFPGMVMIAGGASRSSASSTPRLSSRCGSEPSTLARKEASEHVAEAPTQQSTNSLRPGSGPASAQGRFQPVTTSAAASSGRSVGSAAGPTTPRRVPSPLQQVINGPSRGGMQQPLGPRLRLGYAAAAGGNSGSQRGLLGGSGSGASGQTGSSRSLGRGSSPLNAGKAVPSVPLRAGAASPNDVRGRSAGAAAGMNPGAGGQPATARTVQRASASPRPVSSRAAVSPLGRVVQTATPSSPSKAQAASMTRRPAAEGSAASGGRLGAPRSLSPPTAEPAAAHHGQSPRRVAGAAHPPSSSARLGAGACSPRDASAAARHEGASQSPRRLGPAMPSRGGAAAQSAAATTPRFTAASAGAAVSRAPTTSGSTPRGTAAVSPRLAAVSPRTHLAVAASSGQQATMAGASASRARSTGDKMQDSPSRPQGNAATSLSPRVYPVSPRKLAGQAAIGQSLSSAAQHAPVPTFGAAAAPHQRFASSTSPAPGPSRSPPRSPRITSLAATAHAAATALYPRRL